MTDPPAPDVGLCATCRWMRTVTNRRGSVFYRCTLADTDPHFVRYPPLPVLTCSGYAQETQRHGDEGQTRRTPRGRP